MPTRPLCQILMSRSSDIMRYVSRRLSKQDKDSHVKQFGLAHPQSSPPSKIHDPISMHLLVEMAQEDTQELVVLSFEEVEELKRESSIISKRIETTKRKLTLELKIRDAALSLSRLYPTKIRGQASEATADIYQHSSLNSNDASNDHFSEAEDELSISTRRCENLTQDLWKLDHRAAQIQDRILRHTIGLLQLTHRATVLDNGVLRNPSQEDSALGALSGVHLASHGVVATSNGEAVDDGSRNMERPQAEDSLEVLNPTKTQSSGFAHAIEAIRDTEQKLVQLNGRLKGLILETNPQLDQPMDAPPIQNMTGGSAPLDENIQTQLEYLSTTLQILHNQHMDKVRRVQHNESSLQEQLQFLAHDIQQTMVQHNLQPKQLQLPNSVSEVLHLLREWLGTIQSHLQSHAKDSTQMEKAEQYETVLTGLWEIINSEETEAGHGSIRKSVGSLEGFTSGTDSPLEDGGRLENFSIQSFSTRTQWLFSRARALEEEKNILRRQIQQQRELSQASDSAKDEIVAQLTQELQQEKAEHEIASKEAANAKQETAMVLQQLDTARNELTVRNQQRVNDDSGTLNELAQRQEEILTIETELQEVQESHRRKHAELQDIIHDRESRIQGLEAQLRAISHDDQRLATSEALLKQQIQDKTQLLDSSQASVKRLEAEILRLRTETVVSQDDQRLATSEALLKHQIQEKTQLLESTQANVEKLEAEVVRLRTEVTVTRAELDGAYGTRAQRAAEGGLDPSLQRELDELATRNLSLLEETAALKTQNELGERASKGFQQRIEVLQKELSETIDEYEAMTKRSVEFEKDREQLEITIDNWRERCESLESQLNDEKVKWMGVKTANEGTKESVPIQNTSTAVLRNEFKKMMRDTRAEAMRAVRVSENFDISLDCANNHLQAEQEERRKLEAIIRTLKKEQTPAKNTTASSSTST